MNSGWCLWPVPFISNFSTDHRAWSVTSQFPTFVSHGSIAFLWVIRLIDFMTQLTFILHAGSLVSCNFFSLCLCFHASCHIINHQLDNVVWILNTTMYVSQHALLGHMQQQFGDNWKLLLLTIQFASSDPAFHKVRTWCRLVLPISQSHWHKSKYNKCETFSFTLTLIMDHGLKTKV
jgi:hypothetical protein